MAINRETPANEQALAELAELMANDFRGAAGAGYTAATKSFLDNHIKLFRDWATTWMLQNPGKTLGDLVDAATTGKAGDHDWGGNWMTEDAPLDIALKRIVSEGKANTSDVAIHQRGTSPLAINPDNRPGGAADPNVLENAELRQPAPTATAPAASTGGRGNAGSIVDYLNSKGQNSSFEARKKLAEENGIQDYEGTAEQNTQLLNILKQKEAAGDRGGGGAEAPGGTSPGGTSPGGTSPGSSTMPALGSDSNTLQAFNVLAEKILKDKANDSMLPAWQKWVEAVRAASPAAQEQALEYLIKRYRLDSNSSWAEWLAWAREGSGFTGGGQTGGQSGGSGGLTGTVGVNKAVNLDFDELRRRLDALRGQSVTRSDGKKGTQWADSDINAIYHAAEAHPDGNVSAMLKDINFKGLFANEHAKESAARDILTGWVRSSDMTANANRQRTDQKAVDDAALIQQDKAQDAELAAQDREQDAARHLTEVNQSAEVFAKELEAIDAQLPARIRGAVKRVNDAFDAVEKGRDDAAANAAAAEADALVKQVDAQIAANNTINEAEREKLKAEAEALAEALNKLKEATVKRIANEKDVDVAAEEQRAATAEQKAADIRADTPQSQQSRAVAPNDPRNVTFAKGGYVKGNKKPSIKEGLAFAGRFS
jgi:hypothetical protein